ncbi:uncharacterized protein [Macrobrachium rosenbergii]|uniref:uncharacterized protein n=1 Tax=Macrobrachium rosenbergii TaxID=79674 RepID=UPI0034D51787
MCENLSDTKNQSQKMSPTIAEKQVKPPRKYFMCKIPLDPNTTERLFGHLMNKSVNIKTDMCEIILNPECQDNTSLLASQVKASRNEEHVNCLDCGSRFLKQKYLNQHIKLNRCKKIKLTEKLETEYRFKGPGRKSVFCPDCGAGFLKKKYLVQHQKKNRCNARRDHKMKKHQKQNRGKTVGKYETKTKSPQQEKKRYHCTVCGKGFTYQKIFERHQSVPDSMCYKPSTVLETSEKVGKVSENKVSGVDCERVSCHEIEERENVGESVENQILNVDCKSASLCRSTEREHDSETKKKSYRCSVCERDFSYLKNLERHQGLQGSACYKPSKEQEPIGKESKFDKNKNSNINRKCTSFRKISEKKTELQTVVNMKDLEPTVAMSVQLDEDLTTDELGKAEKIGGKKTLQRELNSTGLKSQLSLIRHVDLQLFKSRLCRESPLEGKPYRCLICKTGYIYKKNLVRHIRRSKCYGVYWNNIAREISDDKLRDKSPEKRRSYLLHQCLFASKSWKTPDQLGGRKLYKCHFCYRGFSSISNLNKHCRLKRCKFELNWEALDQPQKVKVSCMDCGALFRKRKYLLRHKRLKRCKKTKLLARNTLHVQEVSHIFNQVVQEESALLNKVKEETNVANEVCISEPNVDLEHETPNQLENIIKKEDLEYETPNQLEDIIKKETEELLMSTSHNQMEFMVKEEVDEFQEPILEIQEEEGCQIQTVESYIPGDMIKEETAEVLASVLPDQAYETNSGSPVGTVEKEYDDACKYDPSDQTQNVQDDVFRVHRHTRRKVHKISCCNTFLQNCKGPTENERNSTADRVQECNSSGQRLQADDSGMPQLVMSGRLRGIKNIKPSLTKPGRKVKKRKPRSCHQCGQSFVSTSNLNKHFRLNRCKPKIVGPEHQLVRGTMQDERVVCGDCGAQYLKLKYFVQHKKLNRCNISHRRNCFTSEGAGFKDSVRDSVDCLPPVVVPERESNESSYKSSSSTEDQLESDSLNTDLEGKCGMLNRPLDNEKQETTKVINTLSDEALDESCVKCDDVTKDKAVEVNARSPSLADRGAETIHKGNNPSHPSQEMTCLSKTLKFTEKGVMSRAYKPNGYMSQALELGSGVNQDHEPKDDRSQTLKTESDPCRSYEPEGVIKQECEPKDSTNQSCESKGSEDQTHECGQSDQVKAECTGADTPKESQETENVGRFITSDLSKQKNIPCKKSPDENVGSRASRNCELCGKDFFCKSELTRHYRLNRCKVLKHHVSKDGEASFEIQENGDVHQSSSSDQTQNVQDDVSRMDGSERRKVDKQSEDRLQECTISNLKGLNDNSGKPQSAVSAVNNTELRLNKLGKKVKKQIPQSCCQCGKSFVSTSNLNKHYRLNRCKPNISRAKQLLGSIIQTKPIVCGDCGGQYLKRKYFLQHKKLKRCNVTRQLKNLAMVVEAVELQNALGRACDSVSLGVSHETRSNVPFCKIRSRTDEQHEPDSLYIQLQSKNGLLKRPFDTEEQETTEVNNILLDEVVDKGLGKCDEFTKDKAVEVNVINPLDGSNKLDHSLVGKGAELFHTGDINPSHPPPDVTYGLSETCKITRKEVVGQACGVEGQMNKENKTEGISSQTYEPECDAGQAYESDIEMSLAIGDKNHARKPKCDDNQVKKLKCFRSQTHIPESDPHQLCEAKGNKDQVCELKDSLSCVRKPKTCKYPTHEPGQFDKVKVNHTRAETLRDSVMQETQNACETSAVDAGKLKQLSLKKTVDENQGGEASQHCELCGKRFFCKSNLSKHYKLNRCKMTLLRPQLLRHVRKKRRASSESPQRTRPDESVICGDCGVRFLRKKYLVQHKKLNRCKMFYNHESLKENSFTTNHNSTKKSTLAKKNNEASDKENKTSSDCNTCLREESYLVGCSRHNEYCSLLKNQDHQVNSDDKCALQVGETQFCEESSLRNQQNGSDSSLLFKKRHLNENVTCADCGTRFLKKKYLIQHKKLNRCKFLLSHINEQNSLSVEPEGVMKNASNVGCSVDKSFQSFLAKETNIIEDTSFSIWTHENNLGIFGEKPYKCQFCGRGFFYKKNLYRHLRLRRCKSTCKCPFCSEHLFHEKTTDHLNYELTQNVQNPQCSQNDSRSEPLENSCRHKHRQTSCNKGENSLPLNLVPDCKKEMTTVDSETQNKNICVDELRISVESENFTLHPECRKNLSSKPEQNLQVKEHSTKRILKCSVCNVEFSSTFVHYCHMKICHTDRDCPCNTCNKDLKGYDDFDLFLPEHKIGNSYECPLCDKKFLRYRNMLRHVKVHLQRCIKKDLHDKGSEI